MLRYISVSSSLSLVVTNCVLYDFMRFQMNTKIIKNKTLENLFHLFRTYLTINNNNNKSPSKTLTPTCQSHKILQESISLTKTLRTYIRRNNNKRSYKQLNKLNKKTHKNIN